MLKTGGQRSAADHREMDYSFGFHSFVVAARWRIGDPVLSAGLVGSSGSADHHVEHASMERGTVALQLAPSLCSGQQKRKCGHLEFSKYQVCCAFGSHPWSCATAEESGQVNDGTVSSGSTSTEVILFHLRYHQ